MLVKIRSNQNIHMLLMGNLCLPKRNENTCHHIELYKNVHSRSIHNRSKLEVAGPNVLSLKEQKKHYTYWDNTCRVFGSVGEESVCQAGDSGLIPGLRRSHREGHGRPLQYSCLGNSRDRGAWQATVQRVTKSRTQLKQLTTHARNTEQ